MRLPRKTKVTILSSLKMDPQNVLTIIFVPSGTVCESRRVVTYNAIFGGTSETNSSHEWGKKKIWKPRRGRRQRCCFPRVGRGGESKVTCDLRPLKLGFSDIDQHCIYMNAQASLKSSSHSRHKPMQL